MSARNTEGFSLVEVLIAAIILSVVGGVLLNSLLSQQKLTSKVAVNSSSFSTLDAAAETLNAAPFRACGIGPVQPYSAIIPAGVTAETFALTTTGTWLPCGSSTWSSQQPSMLQRIILSTTYTRDSSQRTIRRYVLKTFQPSSESYGFNVTLDSPTVTVGPIPGPSGEAKATATLAPAGAAYCFFPLFSDLYDVASPGFQPQLNAPCGSSISVDVSSAQGPGSYAFDFAAINTTTGALGTPATLTVVIKQPLEVETAISIVSTRGVATPTDKCDYSSRGTSHCMIVITPTSGTGTLSGMAYNPSCPTAVTATVDRSGTITNAPILVTCDITTASRIVVLVAKSTVTGAMCTTGYTTSPTIGIALRDAGYTSRIVPVKVGVLC